MRRPGKATVGAAVGLLAVAGVIAALLAGGSGSSEVGESPDPPELSSGRATTQPPPPYSLVATQHCLRAAGFTTSRITSSDPRLRALGDLAQRTSLAARRDEHVLGLAFGDARLLSSLLEVPNDPYRLETRRNALLLYRPAARAVAVAVVECLRS